ncbi:hypothetical protein BDK51DRAFT_26269 [Blyttiomyces helicus]|uniref:Glyoxalase/Bleomycin resistance protein/Dihydroxybiphenyl dioxygenase n=1 Tax=Blyttiomyces helicus TaxID=388810 RepID=A0A4P9WRB1_9FUNG|nr:hypothetical protein BDK51DRAFT_26269 [Blyttiomyces helicus]|eukprot:RKO93426.1 hypothetical protein BDK51DRAFT_26269 [Blyttiomyces helicus]
MRTPDIARTKSFYESLGMTVDFCVSRDGRTLLALEFESASSELNEGSGMLLFEHRVVDQKSEAVILTRTAGRAPRCDVQGDLRASAAVLEARPPSPAKDLALDPAIRSSHRYESLVIYVRMLARILKVLSFAGFTLRIPKTDISGISFAAVTDPNGIDVRLVQLTEEQANDRPPFRNQWFARVGYYVLPTVHSSETVRFYTTLFSPREPLPVPSASATPGADNTGAATQKILGGVIGGTGFGVSPKGGGEGKDSYVGEGRWWDVEMRLLRPDRQGMTMQRNSNPGFRLVDTEDSIMGLTHTAYFWMSNVSREAGSAICFTQKVELNAICMTPQLARTESALVSIGFSVVSLGEATAKLKAHFGETIEWNEEGTVVPNLGITSRFYDPLNNLRVDLVQRFNVTPPAALGAKKRPGPLPGIGGKRVGARDLDAPPTLVGQRAGGALQVQGKTVTSPRFEMSERPPVTRAAMNLKLFEAAIADGAQHEGGRGRAVSLPAIWQGPREREVTLRRAWSAPPSYH